MKNQFLLTYSVKSGNTKNSDTDAENVRSNIVRFLRDNQDFDAIEKCPDVETTITGKVLVSGMNETHKRTNIMKSICQVFETLKIDQKIGDKSVHIYCVILVQGLNLPIEFKV